MTVMRLASLILAAAFCGATTMSQAAGLMFVDVPADAQGPAMSGAAWYPCAEPLKEVRLRLDIIVPAVRDCPVTGERLPVIVMSHGKMGSFSGHHDTAAMLADAGFVVVAISHPGDNSSDKSHVNDMSVLFDRPIDMKRLIDYMIGTWPDRAKLDSGKIGFFGFSRGGYTGLALLGGVPELRKASFLCSGGSTHPACNELRRQEIPAESPPHEVRIRAAVLMDPAFGRLFDRDGLKAVSTPIQLWASERGGDGVTPELVAAINEELPSKPDYHVVQGARHFAFLAACSPEQMAGAPEVCRDADGFDRVAFHKRFNATVLEFFQKQLVEEAKP
jgi:predicted dienelactone hydrolase